MSATGSELVGISKASTVGENEDDITIDVSGRASFSSLDPDFPETSVESASNSNSNMTKASSHTGRKGPETKTKTKEEMTDFGLDTDFGGEEQAGGDAFLTTNKGVTRRNLMAVEQAGPEPELSEYVTALFLIL